MVEKDYTKKKLYAKNTNVSIKSEHITEIYGDMLRRFLQIVAKEYLKQASVCLVYSSLRSFASGKMNKL